METSWVLLGLACFFDLNKVYYTIPMKTQPSSTFQVVFFFFVDFPVFLMFPAIVIWRKTRTQISPGTYFSSFIDENRSKIAVKFEHVQNICDIAATWISKIAVKSPAVMRRHAIAVKIAPKIARVNRPLEASTTDRMSGHPRIWPDKIHFWLDIVRWPAVISRPTRWFPKTSAQISVVIYGNGNASTRRRRRKHKVPTQVSLPFFLFYLLWKFISFRLKPLASKDH